MAKSFKNFQPVPAALPSKPTSERDFFDLTEDVAPMVEPLPVQLPPAESLPVSNPPAGVDTRPPRKPEPVPATTPVSLPAISGPADLPGAGLGESVTDAIDLTGNTDNGPSNQNKYPTRNSPHPSNTGTSSSTVKPGITGAADLTSPGSVPDTIKHAGIPGNPIAGSMLPPRLAEDALEVAGGDTRQTFVLSCAHLERLRDYVHDRRSKGDYLYSQKQALQEALDLLLAGCKLAPRPQEVREWEQQRRTSRQRRH